MNLTESSDEDLARLFLAGNERAFETLVVRHREWVYHRAMTLLHCAADAEEVTSDVFIRAHRGLCRWRGDAKIKTWLHCIVTNLSRNRYWYLKRRGFGRQLSLEKRDDEAAALCEVIAEQAPDATRNAEIKEFVDVVDRAMLRLSEAHREVLTMRNMMSMSYEDIASRLRINVGTVKSRIARARDCLRREIVAVSGADFSDASEFFERGLETIIQQPT